MSSMGNIAGVYGLPAVWGASLIGGLIQTVLGVTKTVSKVRKFLPPVVVGSVVTAIGFVAARNHFPGIYTCYSCDRRSSGIIFSGDF